MAGMTRTGRGAVIGTGAWGTTLARLVALEQVRLAQAERDGDGALRAPAAEVAEVLLWEHQPERAVQMQWGRENRTYLPGYALPANLRVSSDLAEVVRGRDVVVLVTPSQRIREHARLLAPLLARDAVVVCASKGLALGTQLRLTQVAAQELP